MVTDLAALNNINPDQIYAGQKLIIHPAATPSPTPEPTKTMPVNTPTFEITASPTTSPLPELPASPLRVTGIIIIGVCVIVALLLLTAKRR